jgi:predicted Zn-dependent peptidase
MPDHTHLATLANGLRVVTVPLRHARTAAASVFVRAGSRHESARLNGVSHFVEHMAFKGTQQRDCQRINLDAERLGAEVNAHTDKDHTAFQMRGLPQHAEQFVEMLGDIVQHGTFPAAELERERQVLLHELAEDDDDPLATAFKLFDRACFGLHPLAQPVIGNRANITRLRREDLLDHVQRQYGAANTVVGVAGDVDVDAVMRAAEQSFAAMPRGAPADEAPPAYVGGVKLRRQSGSSQAHVVLGYPIPGLRDDHYAGVLAATLFGEGMSSPLLDELRERRGLAYYAACSADVSDLAGQFVVEVSTSAEQLDEALTAVARLLARQAERIDAVALERARNQLTVKLLRDRERPFKQLEDAALDLFVHGRVRGHDETVERYAAVTAEQVRGAFAAMLRHPPSIACAGSLGKATRERVLERFVP